MKENRIAIQSRHPSCEAQAASIAQELGIPLAASTVDLDYLLVITPSYIGLQNTSDLKSTPFYIDFLSGKTQYRQQQASLRNELLARALGVRPTQKPSIIDATAGLGRDSLVLATLGFQITMLERSAILYVLLRDALDRAKKDVTMMNVVSRLTLIHTDAKDWLAQLNASSYPEVIYMDPMFPARKKAAAIKKEMVWLQNLLGKENDAADLLAIARQRAKLRVVVKRPRLAEPLNHLAASYQLVGKSSRFDIYLAENNGNAT